jgi:EmrB/QacA subfamily drug resistance transporter
MDRREKLSGTNVNVLLVIIVVTSFINPFLSTSVNLALPKISEEFGVNAITMSWVTMAFLLSSAVLLVPMGRIADIVGRKKIFILGNIIVTASSLINAFSVSGFMLILFRVIQGVGSAMVFSTGVAIITSAFPPNERGKAIGINVSAVYIGLSAAPIIGGFLIQAYGWRSIFILPVFFGIFVIVATIFSVKSEWAEAKHEKFDYQGSLVYLIGISLFMYGISKLPDMHAILASLIGLAGLVFFVRLELKTEFPVLDVSLFKNNRVFAFSNLAALINYAATFAVAFILSLYLQYIKGLTPRGAGLILVTQPLVMALFASFAGKLSDKYDSRILSSLGMAIIVVGLLFLAFLDMTSGNFYISVSLMILGTGFGLFSSPNTNSVMSSVARKYQGVASATVGTMRLTGQMMSMGVATMIIHMFIGEARITSANYNLFLQSTRTIFLLFSVLCFFGVFASLARGKKS